MTTIILKKGDKFSFPQGKGENNGIGIFLGNGKALLVKGRGGRSGWDIEKTTNLPDGSFPIEDERGVDSEVAFALRAVSIAVAD